MLKFKHIGEKRLGEITTLAINDGVVVGIAKYCDDSANIFHMARGFEHIEEEFFAAMDGHNIIRVAVTIGAHTKYSPDLALKGAAMLKERNTG